MISNILASGFNTLDGISELLRDIADILDDKKYKYTSSDFSYSIKIIPPKRMLEAEK